MNIFGVGGAELVVIILIMLIVAGPQRMLRWAYLLGKWTGKLRDMWKEVMVVVQKEIDEAGVDVKLPDEIPTRQNLAQWGQQAIKPYTDKMREAEAELRQEVNDVEQEVRKFKSETNAVAADFKQLNQSLKRNTGDKESSSNGDKQSGKSGQTGGTFGEWSSVDTTPQQAATSSQPDSPAGDADMFGTWSRDESNDTTPDDSSDDGFGTWSSN